MKCDDLKIEVGVWYERRDGGEVKCTGYVARAERYTFTDHIRRDERGNCVPHLKDVSGFDVVAEIVY